MRSGDSIIRAESHGAAMSAPRASRGASSQSDSQPSAAPAGARGSTATRGAGWKRRLVTTIAAITALAGLGRASSSRGPGDQPRGKHAWVRATDIEAERERHRNAVHDGTARNRVPARQQFPWSTRQGEFASTTRCTCTCRGSQGAKRRKHSGMKERSPTAQRTTRGRSTPSNTEATTSGASTGAERGGNQRQDGGNNMEARMTERGGTSLSHSEPQARMDWEAEVDGHPAGRVYRKADHGDRHVRRDHGNGRTRRGRRFGEQH